jgi:mRNA interferase HicA
MKSANFLRHLKENNWNLIKEGGNHSIFQNSSNKNISSVPRRREIRKICKDLDISPPENFQ